MIAIVKGMYMSLQTIQVLGLLLSEKTVAEVRKHVKMKENFDTYICPLKNQKH